MINRILAEAYFALILMERVAKFFGLYWYKAQKQKELIWLPIIES